MLTQLSRFGKITKLNVQTKSGVGLECAFHVPPEMESVKLAEVEHNPKNNRVRAL